MSARYLVITMALCFLVVLSACKNEPPACGHPVSVTWLGVTTYAISYEYNSQNVSILLDHQLNAAYYDEVLETLGFPKLDYVFVGHNHFDHTGRCTAEGDILCDLALASTDEPDLPWVGAPFDSYAMEKYGAKIVAPYGLCTDQAEQDCQGLWPMDGAQRFSLDDIGLEVIAFPSAHSNAFGELDYQREHPADEEADPFSFIFEFPADDTTCQSSLLWASSTLGDAPYLEYTETLVHNETDVIFDYQALLEEAMSLREGKPITYWPFYAHDLPDRLAWDQWANRIQPKSWSNHHHGTGSHSFFPDLHVSFPDSPLGGPLDSPVAPWLEETEVDFIPLQSYWQTIELRDGQAASLPERQRDLSGDFAQRVNELISP